VELCGHMAIGLAKAGVEVVLVGRNEDKANEKLTIIHENGGLGYFLKGDVSTRESLDEIISQTIEKSGGIDILINGAGINSPTPFLEIPEDELARIMDINFTGTVRACQAFGQPCSRMG